MKTTLNRLLIALALSASLQQAEAQGTAFTYQGRLNSSGSPVNGSYDLTFALFSVSSGAGQVGNTVTNTATLISNGLFTATMDFGANFPGAARWLEIAVRASGGSFGTPAAIDADALRDHRRESRLRGPEQLHRPRRICHRRRRHWQQQPRLSRDG